MNQWLTVYQSGTRPDCTSIGKTLKKQGFTTSVSKNGDGAWCVFVAPFEYERALKIVWGDEEPRLGRALGE